LDESQFSVPSILPSLIPCTVSIPSPTTRRETTTATVVHTRYSSANKHTRHFDDVMIILRRWLLFLTSHTVLLTSTVLG